MKKTLLGIFAACAFFLTSCEGFNLGVLNEIIGNAELTLTDEQGNTSTLNYTSCVGNAIADVGHAFEEVNMDTLDDLGVNLKATCLIAANLDLTLENVELVYPYLSVITKDTIAKAYNLDQFTIGSFNDPNFTPLSLIRDLGRRNLFVVAQNDSTWYLSNGGTFTINDYPSMGGQMSCTVNNAGMLLVTEGRLLSMKDAITDSIANITAELAAQGIVGDELESRITARLNAIPINTYFPTYTVTGNITCRRMNINSLLKSIPVE